LTDVDHVPASGGGSCARCRRALDLASVKHNGLWYCTATCAEGGVATLDGDPSVAEGALYARPRRHFRKRLPKELKASAVRRTPPGGNEAAGTQ
jgi:hypothetical protein